jgi:hypothetical protein
MMLFISIWGLIIWNVLDDIRIELRYNNVLKEKARLKDK